MTATSRLGIGLVVLAAALLVTSTAGVFTVTGTRGVDVVTGPDDSAYLGIDRHDHDLVNGRHDGLILLTLQNNFPVRLTAIDVTVTDADPRPPRLDGLDWPASLGVGERSGLTADVVCGGPGDRTESWTVELAVTGPDTALSATRSVAIGCAPPVDPPGPPSGETDTAPPTGNEGGPPPGRPGR